MQIQNNLSAPITGGISGLNNDTKQKLEEVKSLNEVLLANDKQLSDEENIDYLDTRVQTIIDKLTQNMGGNEKYILQSQFYEDVSISDEMEIFIKNQNMPNEKEIIEEELAMLNYSNLNKSKTLLKEVQDRVGQNLQGYSENNVHVSNKEYVNFVNDFHTLYSTGFSGLDINA
jgi:hypothetical protein